MLKKRQHSYTWSGRRSPKEFEQLFRAYYAPLCAYAFKYLQQKELAEEVVQDVFLRLWEVQKGEAITYVQAYLYKSVYHKSLHMLEHLKVVRKYAGGMLSQVAGPTPEQGMIQGEMYALYQQALNGLPERTRQIFELNRQEGLTYKEIAVKMQLSVKTVEAHMSKALQRFRQCFKPYNKENS